MEPMNWTADELVQIANRLCRTDPDDIPGAVAALGPSPDEALAIRDLLPDHGPGPGAAAYFALTAVIDGRAPSDV